jgi:ribosomal protein L29
MVRIYKIGALRNMSDEHLRKRLEDIAATQVMLRARKEGGAGINPGEWHKIKQEKARILTILRERELKIR